jgi:hypothetical protein
MNKWIPFCLLFLASCAQIVPPSGGRPDKTPPFPKSYTPDSAATLFHSKTVEIEFDEYIVLKDLNSQLIISPPMDKQPIIKVKNKSLSIEFREPLKDSTTYTINFGNAIQDLHENNPISNFRYVFSTGSYVDSLALTGNVLNALTLVPEKGVLVMLYDKLMDSVPYKRLPSYFGRTDANGNYRITNIKPSTYKLFALKDGNGNYKFNEGELSGFKNQNLVLTHNDTANFLIYTEKPHKQYLRKAYQAGCGKIVLVFNKPVEDLKLRALNFQPGPEHKTFVERNEAGDSLVYWFTPSSSDSLILEVGAKDKRIDTLRYKLISYDKMLAQRKGQKASLSVKVNAGRGLFDLNSPITFEFDNPVTDLTQAETKIALTEDTLKGNLMNAGLIKALHPERNLRYYSWKDSLHPLKEKGKYKLYLAPKSFKDIYGFYNDTVKINFHMQELKYYGTLKLNIHIAAGHYVLQLLDEQDGVAREVKVSSNKELFFEYLPPAKYRLRFIYDSNNNGKWDPGDYLQKIQPEHVLYYIQPVTIRSNWDQEVDWYIK